MSHAIEATFDRDRLASWYAKRHMDTDSGVELIHHLPTNAPTREIRFLEVNTQIAETADPEPIDFGVNTGGVDAHTLLVLDVTPAQWEAVKHRRMALPPGWTLDGMQTLAQRHSL